MENLIASLQSKLREYNFVRTHSHLRKLKLGEQGDVYLSSKTGDLCLNTNIKARLGNLDEMLWGYRGQGPYTLALNLLYTFTKAEKFSRTHAPEFMKDFLEIIDRKQSYIIHADLIIHWIESKEKGSVHVQ